MYYLFSLNQSEDVQKTKRSDSGFTSKPSLYKVQNERLSKPRLFQTSKKQQLWINMGSYSAHPSVHEHVSHWSNCLPNRTATPNKVCCSILSAKNITHTNLHIFLIFVDLSNTSISIKAFIELKHGATKRGEYKKLLESTGYYTAEE